LRSAMLRSAMLRFAKLRLVALGSSPISWSTLILIVIKMCWKLWSNKITTSGSNCLWVFNTFYWLFSRMKDTHRLSNIQYMQVKSHLNLIMPDVRDIRKETGTMPSTPKGNHFFQWKASRVSSESCYFNYFIWRHSIVFQYSQ
jgi:hypothetical protein